METSILVRLGELFLKGRNRSEFESLLSRNIQSLLVDEGISLDRIVKGRGRFLLRNVSRVPDLSRVFGIVSYSTVNEIPPDLDEIKAHLGTLGKEFETAQSFCVRVRRSDKRFPMSSPEIERVLGSHLCETFGKEVDLETPDLTVGVEISERSAFVYTQMIPGFGGLPLGSQGSLVALLSTGIDSPVAAFHMMKRGSPLVLLHFLNVGEDEGAIRRVHEKLEEYSVGVPLRLVLLRREESISHRLESLLVDRSLGRYACLACKHLMMREAERLAREVGALGIVTGEALGQVASQTLENLSAIRSGIGLPVYSPLIGADKDETVGWARRIGTYELAKDYDPGTCDLPRNPATRVSPERWAEVLERLRPDSGRRE
jgi:thiamine biosynthesis protein ThiI